MNRFEWTIRPRLAIRFQTREEAVKAARTTGETWALLPVWDGTWTVERAADGRFLARAED